jgi:hypothetical protein
MGVVKNTIHALSLKQPWAALLVHGLKTIEIRSWPTSRRGPILIHAARVPDERQEAWDYVPRQLEPTARLNGGIIGKAELTGCRAYRSIEEFAKDQVLHLNKIDWFKGNVVYGFEFVKPTLVPFQKYPGWMRFFPVEE